MKPSRVRTYRGYSIHARADGNFYCPSLEHSIGATVRTIKRWIDLAIASRELKDKGTKS